MTSNIISSTIKTGTTGWVVKPNGDVVTYVVKEDVKVEGTFDVMDHGVLMNLAWKNDSLRGEAQCGGKFYKVQKNGFVLIVNRVTLETACTCGGKGVQGRQMYGYGAGKSVGKRTKCRSAHCQFTCKSK